MNSADIESKIRGFIVQNFLYAQTGDTIRGTDSLMDRGIVDSTGVLEMVAFLEREFGVILEDEELVPENLDTLDRLVAFVGRKLGTAS